GCCLDGKPYVVPVNYCFDGTSIIAHSQEGLKIRMMRSNPNVCFEVDEMKSFTEWNSVIAWGKYQEITDEVEKWQVLETFVDKMMHIKVSETARPPETMESRTHPRSLVKVVVYKINIEKLTGRF